MKKWSPLFAIVLVICLFPSPGHSTGEIKGYMFGDYYYVAHHHNRDIAGRHGFWFRRIYFTYNNKLSDNIKMRLRLEMNSPGDFTSKDKLVPAVKDAYLSYKTGGQELKFGIISTPTWGHNIERIWGCRSVEKTPLDLQKLGSSRDFGIGLKGNLDRGKTVSYAVMFGNGASNKGETDKGKKLYASLAFKPAQGLLLEIYGDYEAKKDKKKYHIYQGFASYQSDWGRIGVMYARRHFKQEIENADAKENDHDVFSGFAVIKAARDIELITRFDRYFGSGFKENYKGHKIFYIPFADNAISNLIIGGISWKAAKHVWLIPNIKYVFYDQSDIGYKPAEDIYANITLYFKF